MHCVYQVWSLGRGGCCTLTETLTPEGSWQRQGQMGSVLYQKTVRRRMHRQHSSQALDSLGCTSCFRLVAKHSHEWIHTTPWSIYVTQKKKNQSYRFVRRWLPTDSAAPCLPTTLRVSTATSTTTSPTFTTRMRFERTLIIPSRSRLRWSGHLRALVLLEFAKLRLYGTVNTDSEVRFSLLSVFFFVSFCLACI